MCAAGSTTAAVSPGTGYERGRKSRRGRDVIPQAQGTQEGRERESERLMEEAKEKMK